MTSAREAPTDRGVDPPLKRAANPLSDRTLGLAAAAVFTAAVILRLLIPARPLDATGPAAILEALYAILLVAGLALLATSLGDLVLSRFALGSSSTMERCGFSLALGLGLIGYAMLGLGLLGALRPAWIAAGLILGSVLLHRRWGAWLRKAAAVPHLARSRWAQLSFVGRLLSALMIWIGVVAVLIALAPPTAYDVLMYRLLGPKLFLEQGALFPSTIRWWINFPFVAELGYAVALALRSDSAARLLHLVWGSLFLTTSFCLGRRWAGHAAARWTIAIILGMPLLAIIATDADTDFVWSTLELLSLAALLMGIETKKPGWIAAAGVFAGMALGAKYLSFLGVGTLAVLLGWLGLHRGLRSTVSSLAFFLVTAGLVALPWYLKNWIWLGDPLFPYLVGGWRLDPPRMWAASQLAQGFASPATFIGWLALPVRMFLEPWRFGSSFPPGLLLLGAVLFPFVPRSRTLNAIGLLALSWYLLWSFGPGLIARYLMPAIPLAAILSAYAAGKFPFPERLRRVGRILVVALAATSLAATALFLTGIAAKDGVLAVVTAAESRDEFLQHVVPTYPAVAFAMSNLPPGSSLLSTGDVRAYYCQDLCYPSDDHTLWLNLALQAETPSDCAGALHQLGVTHLLYAPGDILFFHDFMPGDSEERATSFLVDDFLPACGSPIFQDANATLYEIDC